MTPETQRVEQAQVNIPENLGWLAVQKFVQQSRQPLDNKRVAVRLEI